MKKTIDVISIIENNIITGVQYGVKPVVISEINKTDDNKLPQTPVIKNFTAHRNLKTNILRHRKIKTK